MEKEAADQDQWLEGQLNTLKESGAKFGIIFQHIPWFLRNYDEEATAYFTIRPEIRQKWMPKFKEAGKPKILTQKMANSVNCFKESKLCSADTTIETPEVFMRI